MKVLQDRYTNQFLDLTGSRGQDHPIYTSRPISLLPNGTTMNELRATYKDHGFIMAAIYNCNLMDVDVSILNPAG